jgi:NADH dehydrogenase
MFHNVDFAQQAGTQMGRGGSPRLMTAAEKTPYTDARRVVIIGGGYAGTTCAVSLASKLDRSSDVQVLLIEPDPCQQALSELDLVAVGKPKPQFCELWHPTVFKNMPVTVCYNTVEEVDPVARTVTIADGQVVEYWRLVIATGAIPFVPPVDGLEDNAVTMWSVEDAQHLQQRTDRAFRKAITLSGREDRRAALSFVVIGGGATGVEIAGTMAKVLPERALDHGLDGDEVQVTLVEGRPQILYDLREKQRLKAVQRLEKMHARVITGEMVDAVGPDSIRFQSGREIDASIVVWCGGAQADPLTSSWGFETDNAGRLVVGADLKAEGQGAVYVIGDVASSRDPETNKVLPMLAQVAIQQGPWAARNILGEAQGRGTEPFEPHIRGEFVSVGPTWGVGWMFGIALTGIPAIIMKRITYVKYWFQVGGVSLAWKRTREMLSMARL